MIDKSKVVENSMLYHLGYSEGYEAGRYLGEPPKYPMFDLDSGDDFAKEFQTLVVFMRAAGWVRK